MKFLIEKNVVIPINKITDEIEEKSIKYSGYDTNGDEVDIYDLENGKLAPIVRYLIEGGEDKKTNLLIWFIIFGLIGLAIVLIIIFSGGSKEINNSKEGEITKVIPIQNNRIIEKEEKEESNIDNNLENELRNEVDMMTGLKNEAELQTLRNTFELEKKNITIEKLNNKNTDLLEKNKELENEIIKLKNIIENRVTRVIENPKDGFIYYLGDNIYQNCQNSLNEEILRNCKELYYKYIKYAENK